MPLILQGVCGACGSESELVSDRWSAVRLSNGEEVILPHPVEQLTLEELGLSRREARKNNMLRYYRAVVCDGCGELQSHDARDPRLVPVAEVRNERIGCLLSIVLAAFGAVFALATHGANWTGAMLAAIYSFLGMFLGQVLKVGLDFLGRRIDSGAGSTASPGIKCEKCLNGCLSLVPTTSRSKAVSDRDLFPCPACESKAVRFLIVGRS